MSLRESQQSSHTATSLPANAGSSRSYGSSPLDADTPKGRDAIRWARRGAAAFLRAYPTLRLAETDQSEPADVDGILYSMFEGNTIKGVLEIKTRYMTLDHLMGSFSGEWLITKDKIDRGMDIAHGLRCSFIGLLVLPNSKICMSRLIADKNKNIMCVMREEVTKTDASVNGGEVTRLNAFIDMKDAKQFEI